MKHYIIESKNDFSDLKKYVAENNFPIISFDLETDSVSESVANLYGIGIAFQEDEAFYIPIRDKNTKLWWGEETHSEIITWITEQCKEKKLIGHNIIYDVLVWMHSYSINLTSYIYSDTILLKHMIDEEMPFGLKEVSVKYLGEWANEAQKDMMDSVVVNGGSITKTNFQMFKADTHILGKYCCHDTMLCYKLFLLFQKRLEEEGLCKLFYEDEVMPLYREVTIPMKYHGVTIDVEHFEKIKVEIKAKLLELEDSLYSNIKDFVNTFESDILEEEYPEKKTGNYPKTVAKLIGLELESLSKKAIQKIDPENTLQQEFKNWLLEESSVCPIEKYRIQHYMYFSKYPDRRYVFNFKSKDHLKELFIDILKESPLSKTDGGQPKMDDEFLEAMSKKYSWVSILRDINTLNKIDGTYIEGVLDRSINGKLYTSFLQFGTTSGRFASRNPNLQNWSAPQYSNMENISKEEALHKNQMDYFNNAIRKGLIAKPGYKFISADFSALEINLAAYSSQDPDLIQICVSGLDFYSSVAIKMFGISEYSADKKAPNYLGKMNDPLRAKVKMFSLAVIYGSTAPRISQALQCSIEEAQELIDKYMEAFPGIKSFIDSCHSKVNSCGMVRTKFGRIRHLQEGKSYYDKYGYKLKDYVWARRNNLLEERKQYRNLLNNSTNFPIQGLGAHCLNRAMIAVARNFKSSNIDGKIVLTIHDQLIAEVKNDQVDVAFKLIESCMENSIDISPIKLKAAPIIGNNYMECK